MRKILLIVTMVFATLFASAQAKGPAFDWVKTTHNFGDIKETDGPVTYKFEFTNSGAAPLVITNVRASCGCTTSDYTKEPIMPNGKGYVSATYNPEGRPGPFNKSISITSNIGSESVVLRIMGKVIEKDKTLADLHPRTIGKLNLESVHISMLKVKNTEVKIDSVSIANLTPTPMNIAFKNVPNHIKIKAEPENLAPNTKGKIVVEYDATKRSDWGFVMDRVIVAIDGETNNNKNLLSISATIEEDFSKYSQEELDNAPRIVFDDPVFNFGTITEGEKVSHSFTFQNKGKQDLIIRKISTSCGCTIVDKKSNIIKAGEKSSFDITFNSMGKANRQNKSVTIISNDPKSSQVILRIVGEVKKKQ